MVRRAKIKMSKSALKDAPDRQLLDYAHTGLTLSWP